jgi:succinyl-diaminopimelate desuccinylase
VLPADEGLAQALAERTLELVDVPSPSRGEEAITARVADLVPIGPLELVDAVDGCLLYLPAARADRPLAVLAGHLDTVPAQDNLPGRIEEGEVVGLGASDMKGGVAVMVELARRLAPGPRTEIALGFLFFGREELPAAQSPVPALFERAPNLRTADLVIMLEPTDNTIQAGCLGNLNARLTFAGESAHSARPWLGVNAIEVAVRGLATLVSAEPRRVTVDGLVFTEAVSATGIRGGIAPNIIPDSVECDVNFRYAPSRSPEEAEARLRILAGDVGTLQILSNSPPAHVVVDRPLVDRLRRAGDFSIEPKQAWTPVAEFAAHGLDAVNLGPGATAYAHRRDERVGTAELVRTFEALRRFATGDTV